jgi:uroporphyrinogen-III decarboxylase
MTGGKSKSPKRLWKELFAHKDLQRPLFIPLVYTCASKVSKMSVGEMLSDAGSLSRSLMMAQELFGYDGIISNYDSYLELDLLGRSFDWVPRDIVEILLSKERFSPATGKIVKSLSEVGHMPVVFESTAQLCDVVGREIPVIGVINGPVTLVRMILGDRFDTRGERRQEIKGPLNDLQAIVLDLLKAYCDQRVDAVWLIEEDWAGITAEEIDWLKPLYQTFWNVTEYYDVRTIMAFHRYDSSDLEKYFRLGMNAVYFGGEEAFKISPRSLSAWIDKYSVCVGLACPYPESPEGTASLDSVISEVTDMGGGLFLSTPCEVGLETPVESINGIVERIREW